MKKFIWPFLIVIVMLLNACQAQPFVGWDAQVAQLADALRRLEAQYDQVRTMLGADRPADDPIVDYDERYEKHRDIMQTARAAAGLDPAHDWSDDTTYLPDCGPKYFRDQRVPCGEHKPRTCPNDRTTQNSFRHLELVVGIDSAKLASD